MIYNWLENIKFVWPENFIFLAIIPFLIWNHITSKNQKRGSVLLSKTHTNIPPTLKTRLRQVPFLLRLIALVCIIMALARPQHQTPMTRSVGEGIDGEDVAVVRLQPLLEFRHTLRRAQLARRHLTQAQADPIRLSGRHPLAHSQRVVSQAAEGFLPSFPAVDVGAVAQMDVVIQTHEPRCSSIQA